MADGNVDAGGVLPRRAPLWTNLFRCFAVALDPKKLAAAAAGILVMSFGWWLLSVIFDPGPAPDLRNYIEVGDEGLKRFTEDSAKWKGEGKGPELRVYLPAGDERLTRFSRDYARWKVRGDLAAEDGGRLRTMPWYEYRGDNPYLFATSLAGSPSATWFDKTWVYLKGQIPVLAEPLNKLLLPVIKIVDPNATFGTRVYLLLVIAWGVATWAFFGGVITRIAAVQLSGKDRISMNQAVRFVADRYVSYVLSPLVPIGVVAAVTLALMAFGLVALVPIVGDLLYGLGLPLLLLGGLLMAVLLVGLVGYPLMFPTLSVEGSDTFDALSRAYNYVFQAPWHYLWNAAVALVYGVVVTFFVVLMGSLTVYLTKWAISQTPLTQSTNQEPYYLFAYAPETYGWKQLLLAGTPLAVAEVREEGKDGRTVVSYPPLDPEKAKSYKDSYQIWNKLGAGLTTVWLIVVLLLMLGFAYSYFWSAATAIYFNMRQVVDDMEPDEVYLEDEGDMMSVPPPAPASIPPASLPPTGGTSLPMVPPVPAPEPPAPPTT